MYNLAGPVALFVALILLLGVGYGWVMNIINLIQGSYESISTIVIGAIGVVVPFVGAVVHYIAG